MDRVIVEQLTRIADALDRLAPPPCLLQELPDADAFVWHSEPDALNPVSKINRVDLSLLKGIERQTEQLLANTLRFAKGLPANNALLWGARGTGKSSAVKAVHAEALKRLPNSLGPGGNSPRGHPLLAPPADRVEIPAAAGHPVLRRSDIRGPGRRLQIAEGGAGRRGRGAAGQRGVLRHLEPPPPNEPQYDRKRAKHRHQSRRRRWRKRSRCRTGSGCGWGSTIWIKPPISRRWKAMRRPCSFASAPKICTPRPTNGRSPGAPARAGWRGNSSRIWRGSWVPGNARPK